MMPPCYNENNSLPAVKKIYLPVLEFCLLKTEMRKREREKMVDGKAFSDCLTTSSRQNIQSLQ